MWCSPIRNMDYMVEAVCSVADLRAIAANIVLAPVLAVAIVKAALANNVAAFATGIARPVMSTVAACRIGSEYTKADNRACDGASCAAAACFGGLSGRQH